MATPAEQLGRHLLNSMSNDNNVRAQAEASLQEAAKSNLALYLDLLVNELNNSSAAPAVRRAAGLAAKNALVSRDAQQKAATDEQWLGLPADLRNSIKQRAVQALATPEPMVGAVSAQLVAAIASIELPLGQWGELMTLVTEAVINQASPVHTKKAALEVIEFVCEDIPQPAVAPYSNAILTALVAGARPEEVNEVRRAAMSALGGAIRFFDENFKNERERNYIMQVVCQATQSPDSIVQVKAFECLVKIMAYQYDVMNYYMDAALFALTVTAMRSPNTDVAMQGVEFWSTVCDEELQIAMENAEAAENSAPPPRHDHQFALKSLPHIVPVLTQLLTQQEESDDDDEWNIAMAASTCLTLLANVTGDRILEHVLPFVEAYLMHNDWRFREAAVMAFGCVLEGPSPNLLEPYVKQIFPELINRMNDPSVPVQDSAAWVVGKICEVMGDSIESVIPPQMLDVLVPMLLQGLQRPARVACNCVYALISLVEQFGQEFAEPDALPTFQLSKFFNDIISGLVATAQRNDDAEQRLRPLAFDALSQYVTFTAGDTFPTLVQLCEVMLQRLEASLAVESSTLSGEARTEHLDLQSNLCIVLQALTRKLRAGIMPNADRMMTAYLRMFAASSASKQATIQEDALTAAGTLAMAIKEDFMRYMEAFQPFLCSALANVNEYQLCQIAVGLVGDLCRNIGAPIAPFCDGFMTYLLQDLQSPTLHRSVKPQILTAFGDIALAVGPNFAHYAPVVFDILRQAAAIPPSSNDYEQMDYIMQLRQGILEALSGIFQGMRNPEALLPQCEFILLFMGDCMNLPRSDDFISALIALLGDICDVCGTAVAPLLRQCSWTATLLRQGRASRSQGTREVAKWANDKVTKCTR